MVDNVIVMSSALTILVMFLLQQAFIWLRVLIKIWFLSSENFYYKYLTETEVADLPEEKIQYNLSEGRNEDENGYPG